MNSKPEFQILLIEFDSLYRNINFHSISIIHIVRVIVKILQFSNDSRVFRFTFRFIVSFRI